MSFKAKKYVRINNERLAKLYYLLLLLTLFALLFRLLVDDHYYMEYEDTSNFMGISMWYDSIPARRLAAQGVQKVVCNPPDPTYYDYAWSPEQIKLDRPGSCGGKTKGSKNEPLKIEAIPTPGLCAKACKITPDCHYFTIEGLNCYMYAYCDEQLTGPERSFKMGSTEYTYKNIRCKPTCLNSTQRDCIFHRDYVTYVSSTALLVKTHSSEIYQGTERDNLGKKRVESFLPFAEDVEIKFLYSIETVIGGEITKASSDTNMYSQLLNCVSQHCSNEHPKSFEKRRLIEPARGGFALSVKELFEMAGYSAAEVLDNEDLTAGQNYVSYTPLRRGPIGRISGFELLVSIECSNNNHGFPSSDIPKTIEVEGEIMGTYQCHIFVKLSDKNWIADQLQATISADGAMLSQTNHGIQVRAIRRGNFSYYKITSLWVFFINCTVCLSVPMLCMRFISTKCLGRMSKIYDKVIYDQFNIRDGLARMAMVMVSDSVTFNELMDRNRGIQQSRLHERLKVAIDASAEAARLAAKKTEYVPTLEVHEEKALSEFVFKSVVKPHNLKASHSSAATQDLRQSGDSSHNDDDHTTPRDIEDEEDDTQEITGDAFGHILNLSEVVDAQDISRLLHDRPGCFEPCFMPPYMREFLRDVKHQEQIDDDKGALPQSNSSGIVHVKSVAKFKSEKKVKLDQLVSQFQASSLEEKKRQVNVFLAYILWMVDQNEKLEEGLAKLTETQVMNLKKLKEYASSLSVKSLHMCMNECAGLGNKMSELEDKVRQVMPNGRKEPIEGEAGETIEIANIDEDSTWYKAYQKGFQDGLNGREYEFEAGPPN